MPFLPVEVIREETLSSSLNRVLVSYSCCQKTCVLLEDTRLKLNQSQERMKQIDTLLQMIGRAWIGA